MDNRTIAQRLLGHAHQLEAERGNLYRVQAYRRAAETVMWLDEPVEAIVARTGRKGLRSLPGIGNHLSFTIEKLIQTGELQSFKPSPPPAHKANERSGPPPGW